MSTIKNGTRKRSRLKFSLIFAFTLGAFILPGKNAKASWTDFLTGNNQIAPIPCSSCTQNKNFVNLITLHQPFFVTSAVWSADGRYLSIGSEFERNINIYDTSNWTIIAHFYRDGVAGNNNAVIAFDNLDDSLIVPRIITPNNDNVSLERWNLNQNRSITKYRALSTDNVGKTEFLDRRQSRPGAVAVSDSGHLIAAAVGGESGAFIDLFDSKSGKITKIITCSPRGFSSALSFSKDEEKITTGGCHHYKQIENYDIRTGQLGFQAHVDPGSEICNFISYSPDNALIAVGSSDGEHGTITILNSTNGTIYGTLPREYSTITNLQWISNNLILVSYDEFHPDGCIARIWNIKSQSVVGQYGGSHLSLTSISPNNHYLAAGFETDVIVGSLQDKASGD